MSRLNLLAGTLLLISLPLVSSGQDSSDPAGRPPGQDLNALSLEELMQIKVVGAALHPQSLQDAPASVTIITAEDIRKYGYRTLGEALSAVRGFYVSNNRTYESVGVRGFNLPGDYGSHLLVMVNGHNMADNVQDFVLFFGNDFPIDMNLIKQIEIIRGPSSALYGSNAIFATINIITLSPEEAGPLTVTTDTGGFGEKKAQVAGTASLGSARILFSGSVFDIGGQSPIYIPQFDTPQTNHGQAVDMNTETGYHLFSTLTWRNWTVTAAFMADDKIQPVSFGPAIFNDRGTKVTDTRNYVEADYSRQIKGGDFRLRLYYDSFQFRGRSDYQLNDTVEDNRTNFLGDWVGTQATYRFPAPIFGDITVGAESNIDIRNRQQDYDVTPAPITYLNASHSDRSLAFILQNEKKLSEHWKLDLGLRVDRSTYRHDFVAPRAALIYQRGDWSYKLLYGRSFRNPSAFQLYYDDGLADVANPAARPELADTVEVDAERKLGKRMNLMLSAYGYRLSDFLQGAFLPNGFLQYLNGPPIHAGGIELEINGRPTNWLETTVSYAVQHAYDDTKLENSPQHLAKLRFAVRLSRKFDVSSGMQYQSSRLTLDLNSVKPVYLADVTLTSKHLLPDLDIRMGVRNAFNNGYSDPVALIPTVQSIAQTGRSIFVELIAHQRK